MSSTVHSPGQLASELLDAFGPSGDPGTGTDLLIEAFSSGRVVAVATALEPFENELPEPLRLLVLDGLVRSQRALPEQLPPLYAGLEGGQGADPVALWSSAVVAEYYLWRGEFSGLMLAQSVLAGDRPVRDRVDLCARGRLRRVVSLGLLLAGPGAADQAIAMRDAAIRDFADAGVREEILVTEGFFGLVGIFDGDREPDTFRALGRVADELEAMGSDRAQLGWLAFGWSAAVMGEDELIADAIGRIGTTPAPGAMPLVEGLTHLLVATGSIVERGLSDGLVDRLHAIFDDLSARYLVIPSAAVFAAGLLLDAGRYEDALEIIGPVLGTDFAVVKGNRIALDEIRARADLLRHPSPATARAIDELVDAWRADGRARREMDIALRGSLDCRRTGLLDHAERLYRRAMQVAESAPGALDRWERRLAAMDAPPMVASDRRRIMVLQPDVVVSDGASQRTLPDVPARLLVELVLARRPITLDELVERLWPEVDPEISRNRLKANLHRLRRQLRVGADELVVRSRQGIQLELGTRWTVDLWEFETLAAGGPGEQLEALSMLRFDLCARQMSYDDLVAGERERIRALWIETARGLTAADPSNAARVDGILTGIAATDPGLAAALRGG